MIQLRLSCGEGLNEIFPLFSNNLQSSYFTSDPWDLLHNKDQQTYVVIITSLLMLRLKYISQINHVTGSIINLIPENAWINYHLSLSDIMSLKLHFAIFEQIHYEWMEVNEWKNRKTGIRISFRLPVWWVANAARPVVDFREISVQHHPLLHRYNPKIQSS